MDFTPVPDLFLNRLVPLITDPAELKVTLFIFNMVCRKKGSPRSVSSGELLANRSLMTSLREDSRPPQAALRAGLEAAARRGTILHLAPAQDGAEDIYLINDEAGREAVARIRRGEITLTGVSTAGEAETMAPLPDIFTLYEENIGVLTPLIAEEVREAERVYPPAWLNDAIREAVANNKRNWRYVAAILERWSSEGRTDGAYRRDTKTDPDRYVKGKYGHMVRR